MNAAATVAHLEAVLARYPDVPILLLRDRASWHQGAALRTFLADHPRLKIIRLPTASLDLNPQEHVWLPALLLDWELPVLPTWTRTSAPPSSSPPLANHTQPPAPLLDWG